VTRADVLRRAQQIARLDAEVLLAHVLGLERPGLLAATHHEISQNETDAFGRLVQRRATGEPVAYIIGEREFWSLRFAVTRATLIPRPDSETLIEAACERQDVGRILDLGTGSGCLLLAALSEFQNATGLGIDNSAAALDVAQQNAASLGFSARASFRLGDWTQPLDLPRFDLILCNPPYVADQDRRFLVPDVSQFEPAEALFAADEGFAHYPILMGRLGDWLTPNGCAIFEIGAQQAAALTQMAQAQGFCVAVRKDLAGRDRCVILTPTQNLLGSRAEMR
jgi:release factor glutamine methyltransferase